MKFNMLVLIIIGLFFAGFAIYKKRVGCGVPMIAFVEPISPEENAWYQYYTHRLLRDYRDGKYQAFAYYWQQENNKFIPAHVDPWLTPDKQALNFATYGMDGSAEPGIYLLMGSEMPIKRLIMQSRLKKASTKEIVFVSTAGKWKGVTGIGKIYTAKDHNTVISLEPSAKFPEEFIMDEDLVTPEHRYKGQKSNHRMGRYLTRGYARWANYYNSPAGKNEIEGLLSSYYILGYAADFKRGVFRPVRKEDVVSGNQLRFQVVARNKSDAGIIILQGVNLSAEDFDVKIITGKFDFEIYYFIALRKDKFNEDTKIAKIRDDLELNMFIELAPARRYPGEYFVKAEPVSPN